MAMRKWLVALTALCVTPAHAQDDRTPFSTGNQFVRLCPTEFWNMSCTAYVLGLYHAKDNDGQKTVCLPKGVDTGQLFEVGVAYIKANPSKAHDAAYALIIESWRAAFGSVSV